MSCGGQRRAAQPRQWSWLGGLVAAAIVAALFWNWNYGEENVTYAPWLLDQIERRNVESLRVRGTRVDGRLRVATNFQGSAMPRPITVKRFVSETPSEDEARRLVAATRARSKAGERIQVEWGPPASWWSPLSSSLTILLLAAIPILGATCFAVGYFCGYRDGRSTEERAGRIGTPDD